VTEDGDILEDMHDDDPQDLTGNRIGLKQEAVGDQNFGELANAGEIEVGFEEPNLEALGFGNYSAEK